MAYKSFSQGTGRFNSVNFTDDSKRILQQGEQVLTQLRALGETRLKQSAIQINNIEKEFRYGQRNLDEQYRQQIDQLAAVEKIRQRQNNLQLAQARTDKAIADRQGKDALKAFENFSIQAGRAIAEDKEEYLKEVEAQAKKDAWLGFMAGDRDPEAIMGVEAQRVDADKVAAATNISARVAESEGIPPSGLRSLLYGGNSYYQRKLKEQTFNIAAQNFGPHIDNLRANKAEVVVTGPNGEPKKVVFGSLELEGNPEEYREALNVAWLDYIESKGFTDVDPSAVNKPMEKMLGIINQKVGEATGKKVESMQEQQIEILKGELVNSLDIDNGAIAESLNKLATAVGWGRALGSLKEALVRLPREESERVEEFLRSGSLDGTQSPEQTHPGWAAEVREARETRLDEERAQDERERKRGLNAIVETFVESAGGYITPAEVDRFNQWIESNDEFTNAEKIQMMTAFDQYATKANKNEIDEIKRSIEEVAALGELTPERLFELAGGRLPRSTINTYLEKISKQGGEWAPFPDLDVRERAIKDKLKLNLKVASADGIAHESYRSAALYAKQKMVAEYQRKIAQPGAIPEEVATQVFNDMLVEIGDGTQPGDFFIVPDRFRKGNQGFFARFTPGKHPGAPQEMPGTVEIETLMREVKNDPSLLESERIIGMGAISNAKNSIVNKQPVQFDKSTLITASYLGITPTELLNKQLKAYGEDIQVVEGNYTYLIDKTVDEEMKRLLLKNPQEINILAGVAMSDDMTPHKTTYDSGTFDRMSDLALKVQSKYPELLAAQLTEYIADLGRLSTEMSPAEFAKAVSKSYEELFAGKEGMTYREILGDDIAWQGVKSRLEQNGLLDEVPGTWNKETIGMSPTVKAVFTTRQRGEGLPDLAVNQLDNPETPQDETNQPFDPDTALDDYVVFDDPVFNKVSPSGLRQKISGRSTPIGFQYATGWNTTVMLKNGAVLEDTQFDAELGEVITIRLPDGTRYRLAPGFVEK